MKKIFLCIIFSLFLFNFNATAATKRVIENLNVRKQPNTTSEIVGLLSKGKIVKVKHTQNQNWDKIKYEDQICYVCNTYLEKVSKEELQQIENILSSRAISLEEFHYKGIIDWNGWKWTYYLMSQFPGSTSTPVQGRYVNDEGFVCDNEGYIILASVDLSPYTIVNTPFGYQGKVYDTGCPSGILDVYVNWNY